jgi:biopolymer transport protein ExbB/TolQ
MNIEELLFDVADALRVPVLVLTVLALAVVIVELGALGAELLRRRARSRRQLEWAVNSAAAAVAEGDLAGARAILSSIAANRQMRRALAAIAAEATSPEAETNVAKDLADYDYRNLRKLERTRIMVRMGPALGLMGTLIPLSPALAGLSAGDVDTLTENLRVAFSVTVAGLMVGAVAFAISLVRDRIYGQDFTDVEFVATRLLAAIQARLPAPAESAATPHVAIGTTPLVPPEGPGR